MTLVTLKFANTQFTINSNNPEKTLLLAERFNSRMEALASNSPSIIPDHKLALMTALILEDEYHTLNETVAQKREAIASDEANTVALMCETLDQVSFYLEKLADEIEKS